MPSSAIDQIIVYFDFQAIEGVSVAQRVGHPVGHGIKNVTKQYKSQRCQEYQSEPQTREDEAKTI